MRSVPDRVNPFRPTPMPYHNASPWHQMKRVRCVDDDGAGLGRDVGDELAAELG
jgi:hypothetical protein